MVEGVTKGFEKRLEIIGVGYKAQASGSKLTLNLGFSHPIEYKAPEGVTFDIDKDKKNIVIVSGISKQMVGEAAAKVRSYRKPEPYKGKGIRYEGEYVPRKVGKAVAKAE
jgi:large subunit ribosomal protein L6